MGSSEQLVIRLPGGRRVDAQIRGHTLRTDQPTDNGGEDSAPSPFETFLASIGTCAGIFIQGFCANRKIPYEGIEIIQRMTYAENGVLSAVDLEIHLPPDFPEKYREAVLKVVDGCSVKKAIAAQPAFTVRHR